MQCEKITFKDGDLVRGIVYFQYPKIEGNSDEITKINEVLESAMKTYMADERVEWLKDTTLYCIDNKMFYDDDEQFYWKTDCKITYNTNSIISIRMDENWYAGGVSNEEYYGYTFNLKTGKTLTAVDVIGGTSKQVKSKVLSNAKKEFDKISNDEAREEVWKEVSAIINAYNAKDFKFYLIPGKARICFDCYELNLGNSYHVFSVTSKYK
jgi:hypothetical protein